MMDEPNGRANVLVLSIPVLFFVVLTAVFGLSLFGRDPQEIPSVLIGFPVQPFQLPPLDGRRASENGLALADLKMGQPTIVNFWASWCTPCLAEHPILAELAAHEGARLFGVNYKDKPIKALAFLTRHGDPFGKVGVDPEGRTAIDWGVYGVPETFVVSADGVILAKHAGPLTQAVVAQKIRPALEKKRP
jgi:cytochrome c biogenesis protein CcmG/thiol:disulfide interchange protein DsbE